MQVIRIIRLVGLAGALAGTGMFIGPKVTWGADAKPGAALRPATQPGGSGLTAVVGPPATTQPSPLALPAILVPDEQVELHAKASGYVSTINVDIGSRVHQGDVLVVLDIPELADELHQSEATLGARRAKVEALKAKAEQARLLIESARAEHRRAAAERELSDITYRRKQELFQGKAIPHQEFDEAKSQVAVADAKVAIAQANVAAAEGAQRAASADVTAAEAEVALAQADVARVKTLIGYTIVKAPFEGVITRRNVDHGTFVRSAAQSASSFLLTVDKVDRLRLVIDVPEAQAVLVRPGTEVQIQFKALGDQPMRATVTRTAVAIRQDTRTMRAEVDLGNRDGRLAPGMYARTVVRLQPPPTTRPGE